MKTLDLYKIRLGLQIVKPKPIGHSKNNCLLNGEFDQNRVCKINGLRTRFGQGFLNASLARLPIAGCRSAGASIKNRAPEKPPSKFASEKSRPKIHAFAAAERFLTYLPPMSHSHLASKSFVFCILRVEKLFSSYVQKNLFTGFLNADNLCAWQMAARTKTTMKGEQ